MKKAFQKMFNRKSSEKVREKKPAPTSAYTCTLKEFSSNEELCNYLLEKRRIKSPLVFECMKKTDRKNYCRPENKPYFDGAQPIGFQSTISAPHMHAIMLEFCFDLIWKSKSSNVSILDVGSGSGYILACLGNLLVSTKEKRKIDLGKCNLIGVEHIGELVNWSLENIKNEEEEVQKMIKVFEGDGFGGKKDFAPYDAIHIGAAIPLDRVDILFEQLRIGGVIVAPTGSREGIQQLCVIEKLKDSEKKIEHVELVRFVPLTEKEWQLKEANVEKELKIKEIHGKKFMVNFFSEDMAKIKSKDDIKWDTADTVLERLRKQREEEKRKNEEQLELEKKNKGKKENKK